MNASLIVCGEGFKCHVQKTVTVMDVHETVCAVQDVTSDGQPVLTECHGLNSYIAKTVANSSADPVLLASHLRGIPTLRDYPDYETVDTDGEPLGEFFERGTAVVRNSSVILAEIRVDLEERVFDVDNAPRINDQSRQQLANPGCI